MKAILNFFTNRKQGSTVKRRENIVKNSPVFNSAAKSMYDVLYKYDADKR